MSELTKQTVIDLLMDDIPIKMTDGILKEPYKSFVSAGFANYQHHIVSKNWKTSWYTEFVPEPINSRFKILDLGDNYEN